MSVRNVIDARVEALSRVAEEVAGVVFSGGTVIFPTDTVYGIGCDPWDGQAIAAIYASKKRPDNKPLSLHFASVAELLEYETNATAAFAARRLMPGPVTLVIRRPSVVSEEVTSGLPTLGVRVPDDDLTRAICERCGPLAATSANTSGEPAYDGGEDVDRLPPADLVVQNGPTKYRKESTIVDVSGYRPVILREGVITYERLSELLAPVGPVIRPNAMIRNG